MPPDRSLRRVWEAGVVLIVNVQVIAAENPVRIIEATGRRGEIEMGAIVHAPDSMGPYGHYGVWRRPRSAWMRAAGGLNPGIGRRSLQRVGRGDYGVAHGRAAAHAF